MTQLKLENHNAVALLNRLRVATRSTQARERRSIFNGLCDALKGLGMVDSKQRVEGIWEGIDHLGNHWFMAEQSAPQVSFNTEEITPEKLRSYADDPAASGFVPIHPETLRRIAEMLEGQKNWPPTQDYEELCEVASILKSPSNILKSSSDYHDLGARITAVTSRWYHGG